MSANIAVSSASTIQKTGYVIPQCVVCKHRGHQSEDCWFRCRSLCSELHSQRECPLGGFQGDCYHCGQKGHSKRNCPQLAEGATSDGVTDKQVAQTRSAQGSKSQQANRAQRLASRSAVSKGTASNGAVVDSKASYNPATAAGSNITQAKLPRARYPTGAGLQCTLCDKKGHAADRCYQKCRGCFNRTPHLVEFCQSKCSLCFERGHVGARCESPYVSQEDKHRFREETKKKRQEKDAAELKKVQKSAGWQMRVDAAGLDDVSVVDLARIIRLRCRPEETEAVDGDQKGKKTAAGSRKRRFDDKPSSIVYMIVGELKDGSAFIALQEDVDEKPAFYCLRAHSVDALAEQVSDAFIRVSGLVRKSTTSE